MSSEPKATLEEIRRSVIKAECELDHLFFTRYFFKQRQSIKFIVNWHHHLIASAMERVITGECQNLVINVPPGSSKTEMAVINFIARGLAINPNSRFLHITSGDDLALLNSQTARDIVLSDEFQEHWPLQIADDAKAKKRWNVIVDGKKAGGVYAVSLGGQITGFRAGHMAPGFQGCFVAGTKITTNRGAIVVDEIKTGDIVLSYNHKTGRPEFKKVVAVKESIRSEIVEVTTGNGIVVRCTPCHRFFDGQSYKAISEFAIGEHAWHLQGPSLASVHEMPEGVSEGTERDSEMPRSWTKKCVLLLGLLVRSYFQNGPAKAPLPDDVPNLQGRVQADPLSKKNLLQILRKPITFSANEGQEQLELSGRSQRLSRAILLHEAVHQRTRRLAVSDLWIKQENGNSPFGRSKDEQLAGKFSDSLQAVSPQASQIQRVAVSSIKRIGDEPTRVYDIQVEDNHNFFANGILVHNCIILDDLLKADEAYSPSAMKVANRRLLSTVKSRKANPATPVILIMQRVGENDPTGFIKGGNLPGKWEYVTIPALIDDDYVATLPEKLRELVHSDPRDEKGRFSYWPYKEPLEDMLALEAGKGADADGNIVSRFVFSSQYQQAPRAIGGNIIKGHWFPRAKPPRILFRKIYADTAQKTTERNDYTVLECWGYGEDKKIHLLDLLRGKWEAPELKRRAIDFWNKHHAVTGQGTLRELVVEDKSSGTGLIQEIKRTERIPVRGVERTKDKLTRVMDAVSSIDAGFVVLPEDAPFVSDFLIECEAFTADDSHAHDDQIDPMCDAITDMLLTKRSSLFDFT